MRFSIIVFIFFLLISLNSKIHAQQSKMDVINLRYLGELKGKVIKVKQNSVEFRIARNNLLYDYPKSQIIYIVMADGQWLYFNEKSDSVSISKSTGGYFNLSGGLISNFEPKQFANFWKTGFSFTGDLNYKTGNYYSIGFLIGYSSIKLDDNRFLTDNNYTSADSAIISGGDEYFLRVGLINRIFLLPSSAVKPLISIFAGFGNLLTSQINLASKTGNISIQDESKKGFTLGAGLGFFIQTGNLAGFLINAEYNWYFYGNEKVKFGNFSIGYSLPIN